VTVIVAGDVLAGIGARLTLQWPSASAMADTVWPLNETSTDSPGEVVSEETWQRDVSVRDPG
jgi:hypothetical protein